MISDFLQYVDGIDFVDYELCIIEESNNGNYYGCRCKDMLLSGGSLVSIGRICSLAYGDKEYVFKRYTSVLDRFNAVCEVVYDYTNVDISEYVKILLYLDAIVLNEDRHLNNIALVQDDGVYTPSRIFDNGAGLLSDLLYHPFGIDIELCIKRCTSKPFSTSFMRQCRELAKTTPLVIDVASWQRDLEYKTVDFKEKEFKRAIDVLDIQLSQTEGVLWCQKHY